MQMEKCESIFYVLRRRIYDLTSPILQQLFLVCDIIKAPLVVTINVRRYRNNGCTFYRTLMILYKRNTVLLEQFCPPFIYRNCFISNNPAKG